VPTSRLMPRKGSDSYTGHGPIEGSEQIVHARVSARRRVCGWAVPLKKKKEEAGARMARLFPLGNVRFHLTCQSAVSAVARSSEHDPCLTPYGGIRPNCGLSARLGCPNPVR
jgi:hypothetical protein